jgi:hypothetical protein
MKVKYQDREIDAEEVDIVTMSESWSEYQLSNGDTLKFRSIVTSVSKATMEKAPDGGPLYLVQAQNFVRVKSK